MSTRNCAEARSTDTANRGPFGDFGLTFIHYRIIGYTLAGAGDGEPQSRTVRRYSSVCSVEAGAGAMHELSLLHTVAAESHTQSCWERVASGHRDYS
jgi:hypothetical protein